MKSQLTLPSYKMEDLHSRQTRQIHMAVATKASQFFKLVKVRYLTLASVVKSLLCDATVAAWYFASLPS